VVSENGRPVGIEAHKALAAELGESSYKNLLVLVEHNDPFVADQPRKQRDAEWFAELWEKHGSTGHLRRLHYRLVSGDPVARPDGDEYLNNEQCWRILVKAAGFARHLGLVDPLAVEDQRNPDPAIYVEPRWSEPVPEVEIDEIDGLDWRVPQLWLPLAPALTVPDASVAGYDYQPADQPLLLEVWVEKTTADDLLEPLCQRLGANLVSGPGYQSITNTVRLLERCKEHGKPGHVVYIADFDPAGSTMPPAVARQLEYYRERDFPEVEVSLDRVALTADQVVEHKLPRKPIKESDRRRAKFEDRYGEGAVELDALEAIVPGELARIVRQAIVAKQDPVLRSRLVQADAAARYSAREEWAEATAHIRGQIADIKREIGEIIEPYREPIAEIASELNGKLAPYQERIDDLEGALDEARDEFDPELPGRPEPAVPPIGDSVLFDSRRDWAAQLERYRRETGR
jgi:hypothetical protein